MKKILVLCLVATAHLLAQSSNVPSVSKAVRFLGAYSSTTSYNQYDVVSENGLSYLSKVANNIGNDPASNVAFWNVLGKGSVGAIYTCPLSNQFMNGISTNGYPTCGLAAAVQTSTVAPTTSEAWYATLPTTLGSAYTGTFALQQTYQAKPVCSVTDDSGLIQAVGKTVSAGTVTNTWNITILDAGSNKVSVICTAATR